MKRMALAGGKRGGGQWLGRLKLSPSHLINREEGELIVRWNLLLLGAAGVVKRWYVKFNTQIGFFINCGTVQRLSFSCNKKTLPGNYLWCSYTLEEMLYQLFKSNDLKVCTLWERLPNGPRHSHESFLLIWGNSVKRWMLLYCNKGL